MSDAEKPRYRVWDYLRAGLFFTFYGLVKYLPPPVGDVLRFLVLKVFLSEIRSYQIKDGVTFWFPEGVRIGKNVTLNEWVFIDGYGGVEIGDCCRIAHGCSFISEDHGFSDPNLPIYQQAKMRGPIRLESDVWLGAGVRVLRNVTIGRGSVVGAGSVVTKSLPPYSVAVGVPARVIKTRSQGESGR